MATQTHGKTLVFKKFVRDKLGRKQASWPADVASSEWDALLEEMREHSLQPLLYHFFSGTDAWNEWPAPVRKRLEETARYEMARAAVVEGELRDFFHSLNEAGVPCVLLKGSALAYSLYPAPFLRPRLDTDLLIRKQDVKKAEAVAQALGYNLNNMISGDLISHQMMAVKHDFLGMPHMLDIHWQLFNEPAFMDLFEFEEIFAVSSKIQLRDVPVRVIGSVHALLHACLHRVLHHANSENLHWLYDIHLMAGSFDEGSAEAFVRMAEEKKVTSVCAASLHAARGVFDTRFCSALEKFISTSRPDAEAVSEYLKPSYVPETLRSFYRSFRGLRGWRQKGRLVREHLFPPPDYLRKKYHSSRAWMPALYARRLAYGSFKMVRQFFQNILFSLKTLKNK